MGRPARTAPAKHEGDTRRDALRIATVVFVAGLRAHARPDEGAALAPSRSELQWRVQGVDAFTVAGAAPE